MILLRLFSESSMFPKNDLSCIGSLFAVNPTTMLLRIDLFGEVFVAPFGKSVTTLLVSQLFVKVFAVQVVSE